MPNSIFDTARLVSPYPIPPLLGFLVFLILAIISSARGKKKKTNLLFSGVCIFGALLNFDIIMTFIAKNKELALKINRIDHIFFVYSFSLYIHFTYSFLSLKRREWLVPLSYFFSFIIMFFTQSDLYLPGVHQYYFGFFAEGGPIYNLFALISLTVSIYCLYLLSWKMREETNSVKRNKIKYVFYGFGISALLMLFNSLPMNGIAIYPLGNFSFIPMVFLAFGVLKHDLLDVGVIFRKGLIYSLLTGLLTAIYALLIMISNFIFVNFHISQSVFFPIIFAFIIVGLFNPLKDKIQAIIDELFFKGKYAYQRTLKETSEAMTSLLNRDQITARILNALIGAMELKGGAVIFLSEEEGAGYCVYAAEGKRKNEVGRVSIDKDSPLIKFLVSNKQEVLRHNIEKSSRFKSIRDQFLKLLDDLDAVILIPMIFKDHLNGFIALGEKKSGDLYSGEDIELLMTMANQSAVAYENASSYQTVQELNRTLEEKVKKRTIELERALLEKEKTQDQLIQSESLAAIGQLVAGVAHELNNPLTAVFGLIQSSLETLEDQEEIKNYYKDLIDDLQFSLKESRRAKNIVKSLLDLSRQTQTFAESVNLNEVLKDSLRILSKQYKNQCLNIVEEYEKNLPSVHGNFANLGQAFINVINNAIHSLEKGQGKISLKTRFLKEENRVVFECADNGSGIPGEIKKDIFKPFFTTKEVGKGTGLGLYLCHEIIKKHQGKIVVESKVSAGTTFTIELPAVG